MNAPDPLARDRFASLLALTREPFPASPKVHVAGQVHPDLRVPMREVALTNGEIGHALRHLGPLHRSRRPRSTCARGLPDAARAVDRGARRHRDATPAASSQALDDGRRAAGDATSASTRCAPRPPRCSAGRAAPRPAPTSRRCTTRAAASSRPRWNTSRIRENGKREWMAEYLADAERERRLRRQPDGRARFRGSSRPSSCATRWRAAAPSSRPTSTTPKSSRWRSAATSWSRSTPTSATRPSPRASTRRSRSWSGRSAGAPTT